MIARVDSISPSSGGETAEEAVKLFNGISTEI